uniref:Shikimate kinase n=1 Tax=viral metagenome TaxID=1070528 RepID=A0A6C0B3B1_9ZZZZ
MSINTSITLIGMPGAGKSVISKYIASNSTFENLEMDELIEIVNNKTLFELINELGEEKFKKLEEDTILQIDTKKKYIISPGGSVVYSDVSMKHLSNTFVIYLKCNFETIKQRTENFTNRGIIFNGLTPRELFDEREKLYNKHADITIHAENYTIKTLGDLIINLGIH